MTTTGHPTALRCAHKVNPLGVAPDRVRFSWELEGTGADRRQRAYQVHVEPDEPAQIGGETAAWDSGRVDSPASVDVPCRAPALERGARYTWKVRVWDEADTVSSWSEPASFEVELDPVTGWRASWIGLGGIREPFIDPAKLHSDRVTRALTPSPYLRREFSVAKPVTCARLYMTALGLYEARLNGSKAGDAVLAPGWTDYAQRVLYQSYDVTELLRQGDNVVGAVTRRRLVQRLRRLRPEAGRSSLRNGSGASGAAGDPFR